MKQRVADYIADFLVSKKMYDIFTVVGGGAMFLNDAFGNHPKLKCFYNHHEQACTMAAEGYYKQKGEMATACVTTGPGGTNAITGVLGAYQDSTPMIVISGQVRYEITVESTGLDLRQYGVQENAIIPMVKSITKYAEMVRKPEDIRYCLERAYYEAMNGRRGPVWLDIPLNVQSAIIETDTLEGYEPEEKKTDITAFVTTILEELRQAERPLIVVGSAIRTMGIVEQFIAMAEKLNIPITYPLNVADVIPLEHELAMGCFGSVGTRSGNFVIQNADVVLILGCRMAFAHIGFNYSAFSPNSKKITVDIDPAEQEKPSMKRDIKILADVTDIVPALLNSDLGLWPKYTQWKQYCKELKTKFPVFLEHHKTSLDNRVNQYYMAKAIAERLDSNGITILGNSSGLDPTRQLGIREQGGRIIHNANCGSMGCCLPMGIGAAVASGRRVVVYTGDGCIQMNLQELETIIYNKLPIKIIILNNEGYGGIVTTQKKFFGEKLSGCTKETGVGMPDFEKLAYAYGYTFFRIENHSQVDAVMDALFADDAPAICEVYQDFQQKTEPRVGSRKLEDGTLVSTGIEDMEPFLPQEICDSWKFENWSNK